ncbi:MAG: TolC family protein [Odoribacter sp.]
MEIEVARMQTGLTRSKFLPQLVVGVKEKYGTTLINIDGKAKWATTAYAQVNIPVFHWGEKRQNVRISKNSGGNNGVGKEQVRGSGE